MTNWLSRATGALRTHAPPVPEPYEVACDCGGRVIGERTTAAQRPPCPACGCRVFVLPANVYPRSVKVVPPVTPVREQSGKTATKGRESSAPEASSQSQHVAKDRVKSAQVAPLVTATGIALDPRTQFFTPLRLIVLAMLTVCGLTGWGLVHRQRIETAKAIVAKATEEGMRAIRERDFVGAARDLERARAAVDLLKRTDAEALSVRQLCREAIAARGLASDSLLELIHKSLADIRPGVIEAQRFDGLYRDSWVLFDATLLVSGDAKQPSLVDLEIAHHGRPVRIETNSNVIRRAAQQASTDSPPRVIFAAKLARLVPAHDAQTEAVLRLDGDTLFLWGTFETYEALGYSEDDAELQRHTRELLERQRELMKEVK